MGGVEQALWTVDTRAVLCTSVHTCVRLCERHTEVGHVRVTPGERSELLSEPHHEVFPLVSLFFFFQAEDGIRDLYVTGVQTCALPIFSIEFTLDGASERATA